MNPDIEHEKYFKNKELHTSPSQGTRIMIKHIEAKIEHLEKHVDGQITELKTSLNGVVRTLGKKADKSWTWTIIVTLISVITVIMGAQYSEIRRLNNNITQLLIDNGTTNQKIENMEKDIKTIQSFIYNLEKL